MEVEGVVLQEEVGVLVKEAVMVVVVVGEGVKVEAQRWTAAAAAAIITTTTTTMVI